jgi:uncharacterized protein with beta-barrel porin domain
MERSIHHRQRGEPLQVRSPHSSRVSRRTELSEHHSTTFPGGEIRGNSNSSVCRKLSLKSGSKGVATALDSLGAAQQAVRCPGRHGISAAAPQTAAVEKLAPISSRGRLVVTTGHADTNYDQISNRLDVLRRAKRNNALESRNGLWFNGGGVADRQDLDDDFAGYKSDGWGLAGGYDRELQSGTVIGAGLGYADSSIDYRDQSAGSNDDIDTRQISFYASHDAGRFYVQGMFSYGWQQYENSRDTGSTGAATSSYDGNQFGIPHQRRGAILTIVCDLLHAAGSRELERRQARRLFRN